EEVCEVDGDHVPNEHYSDCRVPREASTDDSNVDPVSRGSEKIPSPAERIGNQRNDVLALDQKEREEVGEVIADCDRNQGKGKGMGDLARRTSPAYRGAHH